MAEAEEFRQVSDASEDDRQRRKAVQPRKKKRSQKRDEEEVKYNTNFSFPLTKKPKNDYDPEEEARLERLVFGDHADVISNLLESGNDNSTSNANEVRPHSPDENLSNQTDSDDDNDDRSVGSDLGYNDSGVEAGGVKDEKKAAWTDNDDDENCSVDKALNLQGWKLPVDRPEKTYKEYLRNKYQALVGTPKWAELGKDTKTGSEDDSDDEVLRHTSHLITPKTKDLTRGTIEMKAVKKINQETRTEGPIITNVQFHPTSTVALVAGLSGVLSIFQIDGRENTKLHSMQYQRFPINTARFTKEGTEIVVGSRKYAYCHAYDLLAGKTQKIPLPHGMTKMKTFEISPNGKFIAVCGRMGEIHLLTTKTKELVCTLKMNEPCNTLAFSPDSTKLFTHGEGGEMYIWDVSERTCIHRAMDDGCLSGSKITVSPSGQYLATGSKQGVVNVYDLNTVMEKKYPTPLKIVMNLFTSITSLKFNPTSEILAMSSDETENAFKIMHFPSATVFSNFPSFRTKLGKPIDIDYSPGSGYLGITNNNSSAYLYRLKHYGNY